ncbi:DgyrCDS11936 [Dimorphilus gyrociliatus]|uniref:Annexin n=1 Tax=Dimorphilus gyrociliatus TaxID=2664684 RepID=A0A7I8W538_9ANNE|nr:DgyrCDS11936 [Dimorphilus gyrociliatus]
MAQYFDYIHGTPSLRPDPNFNPEADCTKLYKAMKGLGCNDKVIVDVFGRRSFDQRADIRKQFKTMYGDDLESRLKSELSGNLETVVLALCRDRFTYDAEQLNRAIKGLGTDEDLLISIICTRNPSEMEAIKQRYMELYKRTLEDDVVGDTSGDFRRFLVALLQAGRPDNFREVDINLAKKDAQDLYAAGEKRWGTDESTFNRILCSRSFSHLKRVFYEYQVQTGSDIEKAIDGEMGGDVKKAMLTLARFVKNKEAQFAKALLKSMKGLGTDDDTLIRIIVSRCEVDMEEIKKEFLGLPENKSKKTLAKWIQEDTSSNYEKILLALIGC